MVEIRQFNADKHWDEVKSWWDSSGYPVPALTLLPEDTTFIGEVNGENAYCWTLLLTNSCEVALLENFVKNPKVKLSLKESTDVVKAMLEYAQGVASKMGYRRLLCINERPELKRYYPRIGFKYVTDVAIFVKDVEPKEKLENGH